MTRKIRRSLVAIQILIAFFTLLMLAAGLFGIKATEKIEGQQRKRSELDFDSKMRPSIGKPYTEERHYQLLELIRTTAEVNASLNQSLAAASVMMRNLGGILALGSLTSIVLLLKKPQAPREEQANPTGAV